MSGSIAKNTFWMTAASIAQGDRLRILLSLLRYWRYRYRQVFLPCHFTTVFVVFVDLGFTNVYREVAKGKSVRRGCCHWFWIKNYLRLSGIPSRGGCDQSFGLPDRDSAFGVSLEVSPC